MLTTKLVEMTTGYYTLCKHQKKTSTAVLQIIQKGIYIRNDFSQIHKNLQVGVKIVYNDIYNIYIYIYIMKNMQHFI